ncbi:MAG: prolyl oligopeptidase family serine peptidase [Candidatus Levybacteria bacterium]|nr:prolyl oligopeptidase family serine peptidase [Candidatus Levybacteria bacterium]
MKRAFWIGFFIVFIPTAIFFGSQFIANKQFISPLGQLVPTPTPKPLAKYEFASLQKTTAQPSTITIGEQQKDEDAFSSYMFYFYDPSTSSGQVKKVSGLLNVPKTAGKYPIIVMLRGYVDREVYVTGEGTRRGGEYFAQNGFITLAPDFLGYGESDMPSNDAIEERFQTYTTVLSLLNALPNLNEAFQEEGLSVQSDESKIGIWGHSNGGHIALSVLAITGKPYPTVLWNPVSKPFPYSILYYTDEYDDHGKYLRKVVANFEKDYDVEQYSMTNYFQNITAPIQLHQGEADDAVPQKWSDQLNGTLKKLDKDVTYYIYSGDDHNFSKGSWVIAIERSLSFFSARFSRLY